MAETYLKQIACLRDRIDDAAFSLRKASARAYGVASSLKITNTRVRSSPEPNAFFIRGLDRKEAAERRLSALLRLSETLESQAAGLIDRYTAGNENLVLKARFFDCLTWPQMADTVLHRDPKRLPVICRKGLAKIILPDDAVWIDRNRRAA